MKEDWPQPSAIKCPPTIDFDAGLTRHAIVLFFGTNSLVPCRNG